METFILSEKSVSGHITYVCGICDDGFAGECVSLYKMAILNMDFSGMSSDYLIDIKLYKAISEITPSHVFALGIGVVVKNAVAEGGGIIGNPLFDGESADNGMDYINNGLWCIAFSGRFGVVVKCDKNKAENIFESIKEFNDMDIKSAVESSVSYLHKNSDMFIMLSDGSGKNAYPFAACYDGKNLKKLNFDSNSF